MIRFFSSEVLVFISVELVIWLALWSYTGPLLMNSKGGHKSFNCFTISHILNTTRRCSGTPGEKHVNQTLTYMDKKAPKKIFPWIFHCSLLWMLSYQCIYSFVWFVLPIELFLFHCYHKPRTYCDSDEKSVDDKQKKFITSSSQKKMLE
jgi:hypothetical protein